MTLIFRYGRSIIVDWLFFLHCFDATLSGIGKWQTCTGCIQADQKAAENVIVSWTIISLHLSPVSVSTLITHGNNSSCLLCEALQSPQKPTSPHVLQHAVTLQIYVSVYHFYCCLRHVDSLRHVTFTRATVRVLTCLCGLVYVWADYNNFNDFDLFVFFRPKSTYTVFTTHWRTTRGIALTLNLQVDRQNHTGRRRQNVSL